MASQDNVSPQDVAIEPTSPGYDDPLSPVLNLQKNVTETDWGKDPLEAIAKQLDTSIEQGLTSQEAQKRLREDGPNELWRPKAPGLLVLFFMQLLNIIILLLSASATASIVIQATGDNRDDPISYVEGIAIFTIVLLNAGIAAVTENDANNALDALSKMSQPMANVRRDGQNQEVKSAEVVRGDIVILQVGDICCADLRLIESSELKVNEMLLTGEPDDVAKSSKVKEHSGPAKLTPDTMAFSSCTVTNGKATAIVTHTGMTTRVGAIAGMLMQEQPTKCGCLPDTSANQTPLQHSLQKLGEQIGFMAIGVCAVVFIVGLALDTTDPDNPEKPSWLWMILIAVTLAVAAIPEGIPLCVTISLSKGCSAMVQKKVLVRRLAAVETLGSASVICTDKTGTLTEGKMTMVKFWAAGEMYDVSGKGFDPTVGCFTKASANQENANQEPVVRSTLLAGLLCCSTKLEKEVVEEKTTWTPKGNSSEAPIVVAAAKLGFWESEVSTTHKRILEIPFSSSRKMMVTVCKTPGQAGLGENGISLPEGTEVLSICKGAPNFILDLCTSACDKSGGAKPFDAAAKSNVLNVVDELSSQALRVLAIAIRPMAKLPFDLEDDELDSDKRFSLLQQNLQFLGLVASVDPERDGVKEAVQAAKDGNIRVVMITGDYVKTAVAIGKNVSILGPDDDVMATALDCGALRPKSTNGEYLPDDEMDALTHKVKVFARAKPEDKLEIVKSFQRMGLVSAMTGDGVNDAPALKKADIGVAMGIQGTDVAKGASDMILVDDNFANIVAAVEKGRVVYAGIQKFVAFIMSVHFGEVMQIFVCVCAGMPIMRTPLQILFLILVTDLPPAIALGMEPGAKDILKERPRPKKQPIVLKWMWQSIVANGMILSVIIIIVFIIACQHFVGSLSIEDITALIQEEKALGLTTTSDQLRKARTTAFISVVWSENVRAYTSRSFDRPFFIDLLTNKAMQKAIALAQSALYLVIFTPVISKDIFGLEGAIIGAEGWLLAIAGSVVCLVICEVYKLVSHNQIKRFQKRVQEQQDKEEAERLAKFNKGQKRPMLDARLSMPVDIKAVGA